MATSVTGTIQALVNLLDVRTAVSGSAKEGGQRSIAGGYSIAIASGTAAGQCDKVWADTRSVATGATDSLDLAGTLTDAFGETTTFVKVRLIVVAAAAANTTTLQVARPASNGFVLFAAASGALAVLSAGGVFLFADPNAGVAVTAGTGDLLSIINSAGAAATYDIIIAGTSA